MLFKIARTLPKINVPQKNPLPKPPPQEYEQDRGGKRGHDVYDGERGEGAMPAQLKQERRRL